MKNLIAGLLTALAIIGCIAKLEGDKNKPVENASREVESVVPAPSLDSAIRIEEDLLTGNTNYYLTLRSETTVYNSIGIAETAGLVIRCVNRNFDTFISTPTYNAEHKRVFIRWNERATQTTIWNKEEGGTGFFAPAPNTFLNSARRADTLIFGWLPYQKTRTAAKWTFTEQNKRDILAMQKYCA
ncbi:hypothetical protein [Synechococcus sp. MU1611]|uniref:hypothetical protein n=1 Tax=Synechococcus sp. MU1611 TaxID=2508345 RepID=UPI001CF8FF9A|nr:hypothetical protein [Synechococcus sp. MU1611]MCB4411681.1 hypothetical protein [Synechococcus sp. MU1611]